MTSPTIPPSNPRGNSPDTSALTDALDDVIKGDTTAAVNAGAARVNAITAAGDDPDAWVLRTRTVEPNKRYWTGRLPPSMMKPRDVNRPGPLVSFEGEYAKNIENPGFESWLVTRGWAFGRNLITKDGRFNASAGREFWNWLGEVVSKNPETQKSVTPEQYADGRYQGLGGDAAFQQAGGAAAAAATNPIHTSTSRSVSYNTMPGQAAEAAVDELARGLLGRMASNKELARYRKQINGFLKANPSISTSTSVSNSDTNTTTSSSTSKSGATPSDAVNILEMRMRRGSEGMAFNAGKMIEDALTGIDKGL
jgi:hypothetical protein